MQWAKKVYDIATYSESKWEEALHYLRYQNKFGYYERVNAGVETGIGALGKIHLVLTFRQAAILFKNTTYFGYNKSILMCVP